MRKTLTDLGLDGAQLIIRDDEGKDKHHHIAGEELRKVVDLLTRLEELVKVVQRRGIDFAEFLEERKDGHLPSFHAVIDGKDEFFQTLDDYVEKYGEADIPDPTNDGLAGNGSGGNGASGNGRGARRKQELHEAKDLDKLFPSYFRAVRA